MIHFHPPTHTFNLILAHSFYTFQIDEAGRLVHVGWGPRPRTACDADFISGAVATENYAWPTSFTTEFRPDEVLTFGEITSFQVTLKASFLTLPIPAQPDEAQHLPIRDLRLRYVSHEVVTDAQAGLAPQHGLPTANTAPRQTLRVHLQDPVQAFSVTACYRLTPEQDILERWLELKNTGAETVSLAVCHFASLNIPSGTSELTSVSGGWAREFTPHRTRLPHGTHTLESRNLQTSHNTNPFFMLNRPGQAWEETGTVYFGALAYSGSWQIQFEQLPTWHLRVHAGYNNSDAQLELPPGASHTTPALVCGLSIDGWGGASRRLHAFAQQRVLPVPKLRPVLYNSWEATYFNLSFENQLALAQKAAALGVELFCVDDGWFGARRSDKAGLGDWVVSADVFPNGLEPLVAEVKRLGMQFGLWVEPEMVNADSDLYRQHPDWILHFPGRPRTEARNQRVLDFGRPEVVEYIFERLEALVNRYGIDFFKWDMNRLATEPGSVAGQAIWREHVAGVYGLIDRLRHKHPQLDIQSCAGGGGRVDLGILARTDQVWASDNTDAVDRLRIQEGFSLAYPARCMETWVTHTHNHQTQRVSPLSLRFDVAMRGALGIGSNLNELSEAELVEYASYIAFYKRLRPVVQNSLLYRLERLEEFQASVIEYVLPDGSQAVYSEAVRDHQIGSYRPAALLKGLNASHRYNILNHHQHTVWQMSGYELMTLGLPRAAQTYPGFSRTLLLIQE